MSSPLDSLAKVLKAEQIKTDADTIKVYGKDWTTYFDVNALAIVFPQSTEDVVALVKWARANKTALIPSGGRTGLSGAATATQGEVVVSFEKMNKILEFNSVDQTVRCEPGVITEQLQKFATDKGLYYPVDFAARGSSHIGGNIATNAGGIKVLRYGLTRDWVASLKVVTGAGEVLELNKSLIKNATGYDLRQLFIGSEGTLGFVVEATMRLAAPPPPLVTLLMGTQDLASVMQIFSKFKLGTTLTAFEMFSDVALRLVNEATGLSAPFETPAKYYLLAEVESVNESTFEQILKVFEDCMEAGLVVDGAVAQSEQQAKNFWRLREDITESCAKYSPYKNDISVSIANVPSFLPDLDHVLSSAYPTWTVVWFGHIGDGNLHINILRPDGMTKEQFVQECRKVDTLVFESVRKFQGSISAEHGVGLTKKPFLAFTRSQAEIAIFKQIKSVLDPDGIMNPGKVF